MAKKIIFILLFVILVTNLSLPQMVSAYGNRSGNLYLTSYDGKVYLGNLSTNVNNRSSVFNSSGGYGSSLSTKSIWNQYGLYGSDYSLYSAWNINTLTPPRIMFNKTTIGYVSANPYKLNAIHPAKLLNFAYTY